MIKFVNCIQNLNFAECYNTEDPEEAYNRFHDLFKLFYDLSFPVIKVKIPISKRPKWLSKGIRLCSKRKRLMLWKSRFTSDPKVKALFKNYTKRLKIIIKSTQKVQNNHYINSSQNKSKATWKIINTQRMVTPKEEIIQIKHNNRLITTPKEIAQAFNNYFINDIKQTIKIPEYSPKTLTYNKYNSFFMRPTNINDLNLIMNSLKNTYSTGYDDINTKLIKRVSHIIAPVLCYIVNLCIEKGIFPSKLKITVITPIFKKVDKI